MVYRLLSRFYPKQIRKQYKELLKYARIKVNPDLYIGFTLVMGILLGLASTFLTSIFTDRFNFFLLWLGFFILFEIMIYVPLMLKVDSYAKKVEAVLPDALLLMSSNLKAGLTTDQALLSSARMEFGVFETELNKIGKEVATGKSVEESLLKSTERIKSEKYKKTIDLIVSGIRSGGQLSDLLSQTSRNLKRQSIVDQKIRSNVMMYVIFIFFAIAIGAPLLFSLSSFLVEVMNDIMGEIDIPTEASVQSFNLPLMNFKGGGISANFVLMYTLVSITITCIMGGFILGLISKGKEKYGFKLIPLLLILSLIVFFIIRSIVSNLVYGLLTL